MSKANDQEGLRFTHLEVENFKQIDKKVVNINGRSFLITGPNEVGKSTLIQALLSGLDSKQAPTVAIKTGEQKASTKVKIGGVINGEPREYTLEMYYTPKNQKGRLVLLDEKLEQVKSPKAVLDSLIGDISFDIFKFLKDSKPKQIKVLKELSGVSIEIDKLDAERKKIYDERTFLNRKIEENEAVMNNHGFSQDEIELYSEKINIDPIQEELNSISTKITNYNTTKSKTEQFKKDAERFDADAKKKQNEIDELMAKIEALKTGISQDERDSEQAWANHAKGEAWLKDRVEPSATEVSGRLSEANAHNEKHNKINELQEKQKALLADKQTAQKMSDDIAAIDDKKTSIIKKSKLPIKGLTFTDEDILYNGLPMEEGQINTQTLIDIGFEISMALNPNLRVVFLHEGSLFDQKSLNTLIKKCKDRGYQLIAEIVADTSDMEIKFTEEEA